MKEKQNIFTMERSLESLTNSSKQDHMANRTILSYAVKHCILHGANTKL